MVLACGKLSTREISWKSFLILTLAQNGAKDRQIKMTGSLLDVTEITFAQIATGKWAKIGTRTACSSH